MFYEVYNLDYPSYVVLKSSKLLAVMAFSVFILQKRYTIPDYLFAALLALSLILLRIGGAETSIVCVMTNEWLLSVQDTLPPDRRFALHSWTTAHAFIPLRHRDLVKKIPIGNFRGNTACLCDATVMTYFFFFFNSLKKGEKPPASFSDYHHSFTAHPPPKKNYSNFLGDTFFI